MEEDKEEEGVKKRDPSNDGVLEIATSNSISKELGTHFSRMFFFFHLKDMVNGESKCAVYELK